MARTGARRREPEEIWSADDASRRRDMEIALEKSEARFRRVVESAPCAMLMVSSGGRIEMVNTQAEALFGYARTELLGRRVDALVPERSRDADTERMLGFFAIPNAQPMGALELYALRKDGSEFPVEIGLNPIETEDGLMVLSAIVDISERKQREAEIKSALKEKDLLLHEVHHRVKNNLQVIQSLLYLQSSKTGDEAVIRILTESQNRIKSMAFIYQTLYTSKNFARVDFKMFLDSLVPSLVSSYSTDPGKVSLTVNAAEVSLPIDAAIPCGLIVNELISNALKYGFPDGRRGLIEVNLARDGDDVLLSVSDDGVGIPDHVDPDKSATLGLQLVTLLSEQLRAELTLGRRDPTRFQLRFPVAS